MPISWEVKHLAQKLDPCAWISYSGKSIEWKRSMERRRKEALADATRIIGTRKPKEQFTKENQMSLEFMSVYAVEVCFRHELRPELGYTHRPNKRYTYLTHRPDISVGDIVVIDSPTTYYTCVEVVGIKGPISNWVSSNCKWVVSKVDDSEYVTFKEELAEHRRQEAEKRAKRRNLEKSIQEAAKQFDMRIEEQAKKLAAQQICLIDPEAAILQAQLAELKKKLAELE